jgi:hypothetical protein
MEKVSVGEQGLATCLSHGSTWSSIVLEKPKDTQVKISAERSYPEYTYNENIEP